MLERLVEGVQGSEECEDGGERRAELVRHNPEQLGSRQLRQRPSRVRAQTRGSRS